MGAASGTTASETASFLERYPPFRDLEHDENLDLAADIEVAGFEPGAIILRQGGEPSRSLFVVTKGVVDLVDGDRVVDELGAGEIFGISVLSHLAPILSVRARSGVECFVIGEARSRVLLGSPAGLAFLARSVTRWRERDAVLEHVRRAGSDDDLTDDIAAAGDADAVTVVARRLPDAIRTLLERGIDPVDVGHVVGATIDRLTARFVDLAVEQLGAPPTSFAWIALGSAARHEQALNTDQDHALAYGCGDDEVETIDPYFAGLATSVADGLAACGVERCAGGVGAENPAWRRTVDGWRQRFGDYVNDPNIMATRVAGIAFDYRRALGPVDVEPILDDAIRHARSNEGFVTRLGRTVLESSIPVSKHRDVVVERGGPHAGTLDIKHGGTTVVTNLARFYAIVAGSSENRTIERLRRAADAGVILDETRRDLEDAFRVLWGIRLHHHVDAAASGTPPDDHIDPSSLRPIARRTLGAALGIVADAREGLAKELRRRP